MNPAVIVPLAVSTRPNEARTAESVKRATIIAVNGGILLFPFDIDHKLANMLKQSYRPYLLPIRSFGYMVRRMKALITQIESVVTSSGSSGHVVV